MNVHKRLYLITLLMIGLMLGACVSGAPQSSQPLGETVAGGQPVSAGAELRVAPEKIPPQAGDIETFGTEADARSAKPEAGAQADTDADQSESWVLFQNAASSAGSVNIYWVDSNGGENLWSTLAPGEGYWQYSFVGLVWRVRNAANGDLLQEVVSQAGDQYVTVTVPGTAAGPAPQPTATTAPQPTATAPQPTATAAPQPTATTAPASSSLADQMLTVHNQERLKYHTAQLQWSPELAQVALDWANHLASTGEFEHRSNDKEVNPLAPGESLGENIWTGSTGGWTAAEGVQDWISEKQWYDYASNSCSATPPNSCGHYTQVIWKNTTLVGCAWVSGGGSDYLVCNYYPAGNVQGERPY